MTPGALMRAEIAEQPAVLAAARRRARARRARVGELLRRAPAPVRAARRARDQRPRGALREVPGRDRARAARRPRVPSTLTVYGARPDLRDVLLVAVSQSGGSPDLVETARRARACGARVLAVTNAPASELAAVDLHVDVAAGPERAVAATKSYSAELLALWLVVEAWRGGDLRRAEGVGAEAGRHLRAGRRGAALAGYLAARPRTGSCHRAGTRTPRRARRRSSSWRRVPLGARVQRGRPHARADRHGSRDLPVLAVAPAGAGADALAPVLASLRERGAESGRARVPPRHGLPASRATRSAEVDEDLAPITTSSRCSCSPSRWRSPAGSTPTARAAWPRSPAPGDPRVRPSRLTWRPRPPPGPRRSRPPGPPSRRSTTRGRRGARPSRPRSARPIRSAGRPGDGLQDLGGIDPARDGVPDGLIEREHGTRDRAVGAPGQALLVEVDLAAAEDRAIPRDPHRGDRVRDEHDAARPAAGRSARRSRPRCAGGRRSCRRSAADR